MDAGMNLIQTFNSKANRETDPIKKEIWAQAARDVVAAYTVDRSKQVDPDAEIFHEHRPTFGAQGIVAMSTDGHEVTFSTAAYVQIAEILATLPPKR
jgi:hypothetical protein